MKFARFEVESRVAYGIVENETVREISSAPFDPHEVTGRQYGLGDVKLLAPCVPSKIFAMAGNYQDHIGDKKPPAEPEPFLKVTSSIIGPGDTILLPEGQERMEEEAELVVVMGKPCRYADRESALDYVFGYTCGNDVSARVWQRDDLNWWRAKSSDTFSPVGPYIVTGIDGGDLEIHARVNGEQTQACLTKDLIHDIPYLITFLSRSVTLLPGDLIFTGTTGIPGKIHAGDVVEIEISHIGILRNPVEMEKRRQRNGKA